MIQYCENEAANLILSSFAGRAEAEGIVMKVEGGMKAKAVISDTDLCVLLSNALENAIHACREVQKEGKEARIEVQIYEKQQQVFLQIKNSCAGAPIFENGVPVSKKKDMVSEPGVSVPLWNAMEVYIHFHWKKSILYSV